MGDRARRAFGEAEWRSALSSTPPLATRSQRPSIGTSGVVSKRPIPSSASSLEVSVSSPSRRSFGQPTNSTHDATSFGAIRTPSFIEPVPTASWWWQSPITAGSRAIGRAVSSGPPNPATSGDATRRFAPAGAAERQRRCAALARSATIPRWYLVGTRLKRARHLAEAVALLLLLGAAPPSLAQDQIVALESAIHDLFGGRIVIGEVPETVSSSIPILEGVDVITAHVAEEGFTAILSSRREAASLFAEYAGVLSAGGWRSVRSRKADELSFCSSTDALVRVAPTLGPDTVRARVEFERVSPLCSFGRVSAALLDNSAGEVLAGVGLARGCEPASGGGGSSAADSSSWRLITKCTVGAREVAAHYEARWRQDGWVTRVQDEAERHYLSTWEVPNFRDRRWYAVFQVSSGAGEEPTRVSLTLTASASTAP